MACPCSCAHLHLRPGCKIRLSSASPNLCLQLHLQRLRLRATGRAASSAATSAVSWGWLHLRPHQQLHPLLLWGLQELLRPNAGGGGPQGRGQPDSHGRPSWPWPARRHVLAPRRWQRDGLAPAGRGGYNLDWCALAARLGGQQHGPWAVDQRQAS